jgi:RimJ/RimL family protein N-acetyltransferase
MSHELLGVDIRETVAADAAELVAFRQVITNEPDNNIVWEPGEFNRSVEDEARLIEEVSASDNSIMLVAEAEGRIVGMIGCHGSKRRAHRHSAGLGITLLREYRGRGIGTLMMERVIEWAKESGVITRIELEVYPHNRVAIHLYEKCGFVREGVRRNAYIKSGQYRDAVIMALLL